MRVGFRVGYWWVLQVTGRPPNYPGPTAQRGRPGKGWIVVSVQVSQHSCNNSHTEPSAHKTCSRSPLTPQCLRPLPALGLLLRGLWLRCCPRLSGTTPRRRPPLSLLLDDPLLPPRLPDLALAPSSSSSSPHLPPALSGCHLSDPPRRGGCSCLCLSSRCRSRSRPAPLLSFRRSARWRPLSASVPRCLRSLSPLAAPLFSRPDRCLPPCGSA